MRFDDRFLILGLDAAWSELFDDIEFDVDIVDGFLRIQSKEVIKNGYKRKR